MSLGASPLPSQRHLFDIPDDVALVASHMDMARAIRSTSKRRPSRVILAQHGAGQSYGGDPRSDHVAAYPGGAGNDAVGLFLVPNEHAAQRWRDRYPAAAVSVVGCPKLDTLPAREPGPGPVVALSFHWGPQFIPEVRSALEWHRSGLRALAEQFTVIGHAHPRRHNPAGLYRRLGIEFVPDFADVCRRADVLVADNTSVLFEFASTGRPVVVMNAPWYRRDVTHGLRFWDASTVGPQADQPGELVDAVTRALALDPADASARNDAVDLAYAYRTGAAQRAADAIAAWL